MFHLFALIRSLLILIFLLFFGFLFRSEVNHISLYAEGATNFASRGAVISLRLNAWQNRLILSPLVNKFDELKDTIVLFSTKVYLPEHRLFARCAFCLLSDMILNLLTVFRKGLSVRNFLLFLCLDLILLRSLTKLAQRLESSK